MIDIASMKVMETHQMRKCSHYLTGVNQNDASLIVDSRYQRVMSFSEIDWVPTTQTSGLQITDNACDHINSVL